MAAERVGAQLDCNPVEIEGAAGEELTIDVAILGPTEAPAVVNSSTVHGAEGFLGSAIQLAQLHELEGDISNDVRWVVIHAVSAFRFSRIRRFNEENIDLNRNFLSDDSRYTGASVGYDRLIGFLNPVQNQTARCFGSIAKSTVRPSHIG